MMNHLGILLNEDSGSARLGGSETVFPTSSQGLSMGLAQNPHQYSKVLKKCSKVKEKENI